jgi:hypothetical protein
LRWDTYSRQPARHLPLLLPEKTLPFRAHQTRVARQSFGAYRFHLTGYRRLHPVYSPHEGLSPEPRPGGNQPHASDDEGAAAEGDQGI